MLENPFEEKTHLPSFFASPGPRPGPCLPRAQAQGLRRRLKHLNKQLEKIVNSIYEKITFWVICGLHGGLSFFM